MPAKLVKLPPWLGSLSGYCTRTHIQVCSLQLVLSSIYNVAIEKGKKEGELEYFPDILFVAVVKEKV